MLMNVPMTLDIMCLYVANLKKIKDKTKDSVAFIHVLPLLNIREVHILENRK